MTSKLPYKVLLDQLVSVSFTDKFLGSIDKWTAHTNKYLNQEGSMPHRAFSIFLFNSQNKLLFQRRSASKKTFPLYWTNTCCSHPNMIELQNGKKQVENIRQSLHRALDRQLKLNLTNQKFYFVSKILYKALGKQQQFGEYEVDYVFLCKLNTPSIEYHLAEQEISEVQWISREELNNFVERKLSEGCHFSPWFQKMRQNGLLENWWKQAQTSCLQNIPNEAQHPVRNYL